MVIFTEKELDLVLALLLHLVKKYGVDIKEDDIGEHNIIRSKPEFNLIQPLFPLSYNTIIFPYIDSIHIRVISNKCKFYADFSFDIQSTSLKISHINDIVNKMLEKGGLYRVKKLNVSTNISYSILTIEIYTKPKTSYIF